LRFGATGAGLDIQVGAVRVHFTGEHAPELESGNDLFESIQVGNHLVDRGQIVLVNRHVEQLSGIIETGRQFIEGLNHFFQRDALLTERLRAVGVIPDIGLFELALNFGQPFRFAVIVKGTPSTLRRVRSGRVSSV
jgi:hypothetical protein